MVFLTWATYSSEGFFDTIMQESISVQWILEQIATTFDLQTKKENLLAGDKITFKFSKHMASFMNSMLSANSISYPSLLSPIWLTAGWSKLTPVYTNHII